MSTYTQSIKSILMANKRNNESIDNLTDIYAIASRAIFDIAPMEVIDEQYRVRLITGFTLHFLNEEIGLETPLLFKLGLSDKIYNNAEFINGIFDKLDKQLFKDYVTRTRNGQSNDTVLGLDTIADTGDITTNKTGKDTVEKTGTATDGHTGDISKTASINNTLAKRGTEQVNYGAVDTNSISGTNVQSGGEVVSETTSGNSDSKANSGSYALDTPQNEITNLRESKSNPGAAYDASGKGIKALNESKMSYMTNASLADSTGTTSSSSTTNRDASSTRIQNTENTVATNRKSGSDINVVNLTDTENANNSETEVFNDTKILTNNLTDEMKYNNQIKTENDLLKTINHSGSKETSNSDTETSAALNMEMIYKSMPLLNKLWETFDELFMMLY